MSQRDGLSMRRRSFTNGKIRCVLCRRMYYLYELTRVWEVDEDGCNWFVYICKRHNVGLAELQPDGRTFTLASCARSAK